MEYAAEAISDEASEITPNDLAGDYACIAEIIGIAVSYTHLLCMNRDTNNRKVK